LICTRITFLTTIFPPPAAAPLHTSLKIITSETAGQNKFRNFTDSKSDMTPKNILLITNRKDFRQWLSKNHMAEKECWIAVKRGKTPPSDALWYIHAVEEALCFGWIDSTVKNVNGTVLQRFSPRRKNGCWTELNKERCRRLESLGKMTDSGRALCPDLDTEFTIDTDITNIFHAHPTAWENFRAFHPLYQRVRIDNIQRVKANPRLFSNRLSKLIEASANGKMIGDWNDYGRLLNYQHD
jgi:uncharacterized protein YdeI (YjbR/CyaY-like superfamily)